MPPARAHVFWNGTFTGAEKRSLVRHPLPAALSPILDELARAGDTLPAYLWFDQQYYLPDDILMKVDRISMAHSIEVRPPFLDHRIVEFAAGLPPAFKVDGRRQKVVLKQLMKDKLPPGIVTPPQGRLRHTRPPLDAWPVAALAARCAGRRFRLRRPV